MGKQHKIRWRNDDKQELARLAKNFNEKINYHLRKNPELQGILPDKVSVKELKKDINTRQDLNRALDRLNAFSKRGAETVITNEQGEKATQFEIEQTKKNVRRINQQQKKQQEQAANRPVYIDGKKDDNVKRAAQKEHNKPIEFDFNKMNKGNFKQFAKAMEQRVNKSRGANIFFQNMIKSFNTVYGTGAYKKQLKELKKLMSKIGALKLLEIYYDGHDEIIPDYQYDENIAKGTRLETTLEVLRGYA